MKIYEKIAHIVAAIRNCEKSNNKVWLEKWVLQLGQLMKQAPSGSGIDCGTKIRMEPNVTNSKHSRCYNHISLASTGERLIFDTSYHHMDDVGYYDGWTEHTITVTGSLTSGFKLAISGRDRNDIKEYLHEVYSFWLDDVAPEPITSK